MTGSINELVKFATFYLEDDEMSPHDVGFKLNDVLLSALGSSKSDLLWEAQRGVQVVGNQL